eukprot:6209518-Pleurochrysis_carterae.AAC.2
MLDVLVLHTDLDAWKHPGIKRFLRLAPASDEMTHASSCQERTGAFERTVCCAQGSSSPDTRAAATLLASPSNGSTEYPH